MSEQKQQNKQDPIDRKALVRRHHVRLDQVDLKNPLSVGNGEFAFTADITGLQTFSEQYTRPPLLTQAQWAWHSFPNPHGYTLKDVSEDHTFFGTTRSYPTIGWPDRMENPAFRWLDANPHKFTLGRISFYLRRSDGNRAAISDLTGIHQELRLWEGTIASRFELEGEVIEVLTLVHPERDMLVVQVDSSLFKTGRLGIIISFSYVGDTNWGDPSDWSRPDKHKTALLMPDKRTIVFDRQMDNTQYFVQAESKQDIRIDKPGPHEFLIKPEAGDTHFSFSVLFSPNKISWELPFPEDSFRTAASYWKRFWTEGGAIDFSGSTDPRASELERRIVLSQYLMAIQCAGSLPPQETGLTTNSWHGKFHLEMHWWHAAHFPLWNRGDLLERSMSWYFNHLPTAKARARENAYKGSQWPKMVSPKGRETPGAINPFILWQQPHVIYFCELIYRCTRDRDSLDYYKNLVFETADFLASVLQFDKNTDRYQLGPPVAPAQEVHPAHKTWNPAFEVAYFQFGLETAQVWRERLGLNRNPEWDHTLEHFPLLPQKNGLYEAVASNLNLWESAERPECQDDNTPNELIGNPCLNIDHPSLVGILGILPGNTVNREMMRDTLLRIESDWNFNRVWGWDFPMLAMTAARLNLPDLAVNFLLHESPANKWSLSGNVSWRHIPSYLPANGGLLIAAAMMAAGWDGSEKDTPGFPDNGQWLIRWEGLQSLP